MSGRLVLTVDIYEIFDGYGPKMKETRYSGIKVVVSQGVVSGVEEVKVNEERN